MGSKRSVSVEQTDLSLQGLCDLVNKSPGREFAPTPLIIVATCPNCKEEFITLSSNVGNLKKGWLFCLSEKCMIARTQRQVKQKREAKRRYRGK